MPTRKVLLFLYSANLPGIEATIRAASINHHFINNKTYAIYCLGIKRRKANNKKEPMKYIVPGTNIRSTTKHANKMIQYFKT